MAAAGSSKRHSRRSFADPAPRIGGIPVRRRRDPGVLNGIEGGQIDTNRLHQLVAVGETESQEVPVVASHDGGSPERRLEGVANLEVRTAAARRSADDERSYHRWPSE